MIDRFKQIPGAFDSANSAMTQVVQTQTDMTDGAKALGINIDPVTGELIDQDGALQGLSASAWLKARLTSHSQVTSTAGSTDLMGTAFQLTDAIGSLEDATEKLGAGLVTNGKSFDTWSENGRANIKPIWEAGVTTLLSQRTP